MPKNRDLESLIDIAFYGRQALIPWQEIAGIRDRLVHDYKNIDLDILWRVVSVEIPPLLVSLEPLLPQEN